MTDINSRLIRFNGEIGPQYLDAEDKTDGLDGTMKAVEGKDGNLYVLDRDVKAELELIKQQQQQILQRLDEPIPTRLTGSKVECVFTRGIRTSSQVKDVNVPYGAKGCIITQKIHSVTGTFATNEGLGLAYIEDELGLNFRLDTAYTTQSGALQQMYICPGINFDESKITHKFYSSNKYMFVPLPISSKIKVQARITGAFSEGQGIDFETVIRWIM